MFRCQACGALNRVGKGQAGTAVCGRCKAALEISGAPQEVDSEALARAVASSPVPVLVDFWAPWCGPCKAAAPGVDALARERAGELLVLKLNTDENAAAASSYGIQGIPTFIVFKGGQPAARRSGAMPKPVLAQWVSEAAGQPG